MTKNATDLRTETHSKYEKSQIAIEWLSVLLTHPLRLKEPDSWIGHLPFSFLLMSILKPKTVVELGTHTGNSYFSFCQAVAEFGLRDTHCFAVDTWQGDEHSGEYGQEIYNDVDSYNRSNYSEYSTLIRSTFDDALGKFNDHSIDLLHIDGLHTYEAVKHDFETWIPKISETGIVLLHDTNVRENGFGV